MKITFLGTGNAFAPRRDWGCVLVNDHILLEAAPSLLVNLKRVGVPPADLTHLFISHFHGDHFFGLPFLLLEYMFLSRTEAPLAIIGPPGIEARTREVLTLAYPDVVRETWPRPITFREAENGHTDIVLGQAYTPVAMEHGKMQAFGYRLELPDGVLAYSGDTRMTASVHTLAAGARALILEAASDEVNPVHLGQQALRDILAGVPADCAVFLNHLDTPDGEAWAELPARVPRDRQSFTISGPPGSPPEVRHD